MEPLSREGFVLSCYTNNLSVAIEKYNCVASDRKNPPKSRETLTGNGFWLTENTNNLSMAIEVLSRVIFEG
ncbi:MAG: hypothetical protein N4J56_004614 [Chroococcidiopsis sp. SAG 2025]|nr:hypothetical protein [Chroococcidiopsis sp. SAG 2025]